ncbi:MAG: YicC family protein [Bacteroidaceae bacterium]|nr:YicC family protein [Bacteroidaceae bacterium]
MIQSMTGYGKAMGTYGHKKIFAEIRSLNSKALDLSTRIVPLYREKEMEIRNLISKTLERGKVEFNLWVEKDACEVATPINGSLVANYYTQIKGIAEQYGIPQPEEWFTTLLRMPDVMTRVEATELNDEEWAVVNKVITDAVNQLVDFRKQEGEALAKKFDEKLNNIAALMKDIEPYEEERVQKIRERIVDNLSKLPIEYDKNRLEQELIYYIEKLDINEEKQRLANHLAYFRQTMNEGQGQGKKLGFIAQEMGREINTTGSKSNQAEMQNIVVKMKDELEQIKEQVLNVM